tara:strand:- start:46 stop:360 length:315 start_codon:yes stop_codon:yes gene_type:complete
MTQNTWTISQCDRELSDGGITTAHWRVTATQTVEDVEYTASIYSTCGFTPDPESGDYTPYADVTEAEVLGWCWANGVDQEAIETALQTNIDLQITPTTGAGVPW